MIQKPTYEELEQRVKELEKELHSQKIDSKQTEGALRETERRYRSVFDQTFQFIGLMTLDGKLIEANRAALSFSEIELKDVIGKQFWETIWWTHSTELQDRLKLAIQRAAAGHFDRFEAFHPGIDDSIHYVDVSIKPVKDETGNVIFLIPEGRDITERKQAEEAREKLLNSLQEALQKVKTLSGLLPICSKCKKIRDDTGNWNTLEGYIENHSEVSFTHGMCMDCSDELYGKKDWYIKRKKNKKE